MSRLEEILMNEDVRSAFESAFAMSGDLNPAKKEQPDAIEENVATRLMTEVPEFEEFSHRFGNLVGKFVMNYNLLRRTLEKNPGQVAERLPTLEDVNLLDDVVRYLKPFTAALSDYKAKLPKEEQKVIDSILVTTSRTPGLVHQIGMIYRDLLNAAQDISSPGRGR